MRSGDCVSSERWHGIRTNAGANEDDDVADGKMMVTGVVVCIEVWEQQIHLD